MDGGVSANDDVAGEPGSDLEGNGGAGWLERVIPFAPTCPPYNLALLFCTSLTSSLLGS